MKDPETNSVWCAMFCEVDKWKEAMSCSLSNKKVGHRNISGYWVDADDDDDADADNGGGNATIHVMSRCHVSKSRWKNRVTCTMMIQSYIRWAKILLSVRPAIKLKSAALNIHYTASITLLKTFTSDCCSRELQWFERRVRKLTSLSMRCKIVDFDDRKCASVL